MSPAGFKYQDHEWIELTQDRAAGSLHYAQQQLGDVVYIRFECRTDNQAGRVVRHHPIGQVGVELCHRYRCVAEVNTAEGQSAP